MTNENEEKFDIQEFDPMVAELQSIVEQTKDITATDLNDKQQIEVVKKSRIALRDARVAVEKTGKALRDKATKYNKAVKARENELIAIIEPEELRLKQIEEEAKKIKIKQERLAVLPQRKQHLAVIGDNVEVSDEELLEMDDTEFLTYYQNRMTAQQALKQAEIERQQQELAKEAERLENEKLAQERADLARKQEREKAEQEKKDAYEKEQREKLEARVKKIKDLGLKLDFATNAYVLDDFNVPFLDIQTMDDTGFAELVSKMKIEMERRVEQKRIEAEQKAELERLEKEKKEREANVKYQSWLSENGYTDETKDEFFIENHDHCVVLYKLVGTYYPEDNK